MVLLLGIDLSRFLIVQVGGSEGYRDLATRARGMYHVTILALSIIRRAYLSDQEGDY